ncbi:hypothetical protein JCM11491_003683 [Sporobolomyces phaffii]
MQSLLNRRANAPARQLSLSNVSTPSNGSPYQHNSPYFDDYRQQTSAPLMPPPSWPNNSAGGGPGRGGASFPQSHIPEYLHQHPLPQYFFDGPLPNTSFALDLAPFSAFTPSTLAKMNLTPTSTYDFSSATATATPSHVQASGITQPANFSPNGVAFTGHSVPSSSQPGDPSFSSSLSGFATSTQHQTQPPPPTFTLPPNYQLPLGPPTNYYPQYQQSEAFETHSHDGVPNPGFASSIHLRSPGVTFSSSSIPPNLREDEQARYYFDRRG